MKKFNLLTLFTLSLLCVTSCVSEKQSENERPKFWTWGGYNPNENWDSTFTEMKRVGFDGFLMSGDVKAFEHIVPIAKKHGIEVHAWVWSLNAPNEELIKNHPDWFSVNRLGHSLVDSQAYVGYYKFLCPIIPEAREWVKDNYRRLCQIDGITGVSLDYHRYVDVILPKGLWAGYGIVQDKEYAQWDYGYHSKMIEGFKAQYGYDPRDQEDPSQDEKWLQFRCDLVTSLANEIADIAHENGKLISASPFPTPKMARAMVRQDWGKWKLDLVFPMIYHGCYTNEFSFIEECVKEDMVEKYPSSELYCGLHVPDFNSESRIEDAMRLALKSGAKGIALYTFSSLTPEQKEAIKIVADSVKSAR